MVCRGGIDEAEKQRLKSQNSLFGPPPHDATCSICGRIIAAYLIGSEWVLKQHDAVIRRHQKGKSTKQPAGKRVVKGRRISSYFKMRKVHTKRSGRKVTRRKR